MIWLASKLFVLVSSVRLNLHIPQSLHYCHLCQPRGVMKSNAFYILKKNVIKLQESSVFNIVREIYFQLQVLYVKLITGTKYLKGGSVVMNMASHPVGRRCVQGL